MPTYRKVKLKNGLGEYVYPEIDPGDAGGGFIITLTQDQNEIWTGDKTFGEAWEAFSGGLNVLFKFVWLNGSIMTSTVKYFLFNNPDDEYELMFDQDGMFGTTVLSGAANDTIIMDDSDPIE